MVVTSAPSACTASTLHDFTLVPSRCTVHAPQLLVSHPMTVPVLPRRSRRYCTSSIRGSTSSETFAPSTVRLIRVMDDSLEGRVDGRVTPLTLGTRGWRMVGGGRRYGAPGREDGQRRAAASRALSSGPAGCGRVPSRARQTSTTSVSYGASSP